MMLGDDIKKSAASLIVNKVMRNFGIDNILYYDIFTLVKGLFDYENMLAFMFIGYMIYLIKDKFRFKWGSDSKNWVYVYDVDEIYNITDYLMKKVNLDCTVRRLNVVKKNGSTFNLTQPLRPVKFSDKFGDKEINGEIECCISENIEGTDDTFNGNSKVGTCEKSYYVYIKMRLDNESTLNYLKFINQMYNDESRLESLSVRVILSADMSEKKIYLSKRKMVNVIDAMDYFFHPDKKKILEEIEEFDKIAKSEIYNPYNSEMYGMCLYGPPGTGKTDFILKLAYKLKRNILHLNIENMNINELEKIIEGTQNFADEKSNKLNGQHKNFIYVFDEFDSMINDIKAQDLLRFFSGVIKYTGGIFVVTTNKFDDIYEINPALFRTGRLNKINFGKFNNEMINEIVYKYFGVEVNEEYNFDCNADIILNANYIKVLNIDNNKKVGMFMDLFKVKGGENKKDE